MADRGGHVLGVEGARHAQRDEPGFAGGSAASASSCSSVPAATICPGPLSLAGVSPGRRGREDLLAVRHRAPRSSRSAWRPRPRPSHDRARARAPMACSALIAPAPAAAASSPTLCPATAPTRSRASDGLGNSLEGRDQGGGDQQRLGDLGVADGLRVGFGRSGPGRGRPPSRATRSGPRRWGLEPGRKEARRLGALAGSNDDEHDINSAGKRAPPRLRRKRISAAVLCGTLQRAGGSILSLADWRPASAIWSVNASRGCDGEWPDSSAT